MPQIAYSPDKHWGRDLEGGQPPQPGTPSIRDVEDMLLLAAWAHGINAGEACSRLPLFCFIQAWIATKREENLQGTLEPSMFRQQATESGRYVLLPKGHKECLNQFGEMPEPRPIDDTYEFHRFIGDRLLVKVVVHHGGYSVFIDGQRVSGRKASELLSKGVVLPGTEPRPRDVLSWVIDGDFRWKRIRQ